MTVRVHCRFVTPTGEPVRGARVEIQAAKAGFSNSEVGVVMPRMLEATTNDAGECLVELWPSREPYVVRGYDPVSSGEIACKIFVPWAAPGVTLRLQDLVEVPRPPA